MLMTDKDWNIKKKTKVPIKKVRIDENKIILIYVFDKIRMPEDFNDLYNEIKKLL